MTVTYEILVISLITGLTEHILMVLDSLIHTVKPSSVYAIFKC